MADYDKYLKYKTKYLNLKNILIGGGPKTQSFITKISKDLLINFMSGINNNFEFFNYVDIFPEIKELVKNTPSLKKNSRDKIESDNKQLLKTNQLLITFAQPSNVNKDNFCTIYTDMINFIISNIHVILYNFNNNNTYKAQLEKHFNYIIELFIKNRNLCPNEIIKLELTGIFDHNQSNNTFINYCKYLYGKKLLELIPNFNIEDEYSKTLTKTNNTLLYFNLRKHKDKPTNEIISLLDNDPELNKDSSINGPFYTKRIGQIKEYVNKILLSDIDKRLITDNRDWCTMYGCLFNLYLIESILKQYNLEKDSTIIEFLNEEFNYSEWIKKFDAYLSKNIELFGKRYNEQISLEQKKKIVLDEMIRTYLTPDNIYIIIFTINIYLFKYKHFVNNEEHYTKAMYMLDRMIIGVLGVNLSFEQYTEYVYNIRLINYTKILYN